MLFNDKLNKSGGTMSGDLTVDRSNGTTSTVGYGLINVGNPIPQGTEKNAQGLIDVYGTTQYRSRIKAGALTGNREIELPNASGTLPVIHSESGRQDIYLSTDNNWSNMFKFGMGNNTMDLYACSTTGNQTHLNFDSSTKKIIVETPNGTFYVQGQ